MYAFCVYDSFRGSIIVIASCHGTEQQDTIDRYYPPLDVGQRCVGVAVVLLDGWLAVLSTPVGRYIFLLLGFIENCTCIAASFPRFMICSGSLNVR